MNKILKNEYLWLVLIPVFTTMFFFSEQLFGGQYFWTGYWSDVTELVTPFFQFNAEAFGKGEIPFWNPYAYGGTIHIAEPDIAFFYPFHFIGYVLVNAGMSPFTWIAFTIIFHFWLMQIALAWLMKKNGFSLWASLFTAIAFVFSSKIVFAHNYVSFIINLAWVPFTLLALQQFLKTNKWKWALLMALTFAFSFLGGNTNIVFFSLIIYIVYFVVWFINEWIQQKHLKFFAPKILPLLISVVFILLLTMPQLIETLSFLPYSTRDAITFDFASDGSLQWKQIATVFSPKIFGFYSENAPTAYPFWDATTGNRAQIYHYWETAFFFGLSTFVLAFVGAYHHFKKPMAIMALFLIVFGFYYALGKNSFLYQILFDYIPGFNKFRIPSRALIFTVFGFAILAGYGFKTLFESQAERKQLLIPFVLAIVVLLFINNSIEIPKMFQAKANPFLSLSKRFMLLTIIIGALAIFNVIKQKKFLGIAMLVLLFAELSFANKDYKNSKTDPNKIYFADKTQYKNLYPDTSKEFFRISPKNYRYRLFRRNQATFMQLYSTDGLYALMKKYERPKATPTSALESVRYTLAHQTNAQGQFTGRFQIEENKNILPYARMVYKAKVYAQNPATAEGIDFENEVPLNQAINLSLPQKNKAEVAHQIDYVNYSLNNRKFKVNTKENGIFVLGEFFYPAWKVSVNGKPTELLKTNFYQQGVALSAGENEVEFQYKNDYFWLSFYVYCLLLVVLPFAMFYLFFKDKKNTQTLKTA